MTAVASPVQDSYPTRTPDRAPAIPRTEPTVWDPVATGPLQPSELASYQANGYLLTDGLLSDGEVRTFQHEVNRLVDDPRLVGDPRVVMSREPAGEVARQSAGDPAVVRSVFEVHRISPLIGELVRDPRILGRARQILSSEVYVHQSRVSYLPAFSGTGSYWHADFETWHAEDGMPAPRACGISIALTDTSPYNAGLMLLPGSHRTFVPCQAGSPALPSRARVAELAAEHGIEQFTGPAGSTLVLDANVMHGAGNNIAPYPRLTIYVVFNSVDNALVDPFAAAGPRPEYLACRDFTPLAR